MPPSEIGAGPDPFAPGPDSPYWVRLEMIDPEGRSTFCCFSHSLVGSPRELVGVFRRRISWDDGVMREPAGAGAVAFSMNRCCRSGGDVGARAPSVGKGWASAVHLSMPCPHGPQDGARSAGRVHIVTAWRCGARVVVSAFLWTREELARTGSLPPGHGRCSFGMNRGTPARDTLGPRRGAMQASSAVRIIRTGDVRSPATAPTRARPRAGHESLAGTAPKATPPSACCPIAWPHGFRAPSMRSNRWWRTPSRPRA